MNVQYEAAWIRFLRKESECFINFDCDEGLLVVDGRVGRFGLRVCR